MHGKMGEPATNTCQQSRGLRTEGKMVREVWGRTPQASAAGPGQVCPVSSKGKELYVSNQPSSDSDFVSPPPTYKLFCSGGNRDSSSLRKVSY